MNRTGIYSRVSTRGQMEGGSLEVHEMDSVGAEESNGCPVLPEEVVAEQFIGPVLENECSAAFEVRLLEEKPRLCTE